MRRGPGGLTEEIIDYQTAQGGGANNVPYGKTDERGIADFGGWKGAFFKDSEGNIIAIGRLVNA